MSIHNPKILILGAHGMLGRTVFSYLKKDYPNSTWGTIREKRNKLLFYYNAYDYNHLIDLIDKIKGIDYVINCIGVLRDSSDIQDLVHVNSFFPHFLENLSEEKNFKLIHISTDAVFSPLEKDVFENTPPNPVNKYGMSKYLGETESKNAITFRSSFIGLDSINHKGLLEWSLQAQDIKGYTNQSWSGCTTLQFAKLCKLIIENDAFLHMRQQSSLFHFSPLVNITKYDLIKTFLLLIKSKKQINKRMSEPITRLLKTKYAHALYLEEQKRTLKEALQELMLYTLCLKENHIKN